ncbi:MAG: hypothetical protein KIH01_08440, partial [Candidatus Freyarchaeota archaeon]|nr:hypothetical protein [Candidatus Jordarchaeia archaeon]
KPYVAGGERLMDANVWSLFREMENGRLRVKALALRSELAKYGLASEDKVRKTWETSIEEVMKLGNGVHVKVTDVRFLNVYCIVEMEVSRGNGEAPS